MAFNYKLFYVFCLVLIGCSSSDRIEKLTGISEDFFLKRIPPGEMSTSVQNDFIENPIIKGFNPDPAIIRVNDDYFIATSSFEWFPGVPLYHSKDLVHWRPVGHALTRTSQVDLKGIPNSAGIYAPSLKYHNGTYYLIYTIVKTDGTAWPMMATPNYIVTTKDIYGKWSEPKFINSTGFDPSLFIDDDGRAYFMTMYMNFKKGEPGMSRIALQEIDLETLELQGVQKIIIDTGWTPSEGPHIYKKDGYYYLFLAQGGTFYNHTVSVARSKNIWGDYEMAPHTPLITSKDNDSLELQRAGHGSMINTPDGKWLVAHLASRSLMPQRKSPLGRETCLQEIVWKEDGWPELSHGGHNPLTILPAPIKTAIKFEKEGGEEFDKPYLSMAFQFLREGPDESWFDLQSRPGYLRMRGRKPHTSLFEQSMIARRLQSYQATAETYIEFEPDSYRQKAGLSLYYDTENFAFLNITYDEEIGKCIEVLTKVTSKFEVPLRPAIPLKSGMVKLKIEVNGDKFQFWYQQEGDWQPAGPALELGDFADEQLGRSGFTGSMLSITVQDLLYENKWASFDYFRYTDK